MNINKNLSNFFNVSEPSEKPIVEKNTTGGTFDNNNFQKDYELAQSNYKDLLGSGTIEPNKSL